MAPIPNLEKCSDCGKIKSKFAPWWYLRKNVCYGHLDKELKLFLEPINKSDIQNDDTLCIWHKGILRRIAVSEFQSWMKERS